MTMRTTGITAARIYWLIWICATVGLFLGQIGGFSFWLLLAYMAGLWGIFSILSAYEASRLRGHIVRQYPQDWARMQQGNPARELMLFAFFERCADDALLQHLCATYRGIYLAGWTTLLLLPLVLFLLLGV